MSKTGEIKLEGLIELQKKLSNVTQKGGISAVRAALRSSNAIQRKTLKSDVRMVTRESSQSTGATWRSISLKQSYPQRGSKYRGYAMAGIKRRYSEMSQTRSPWASSPSKKKGKYLTISSETKRSKGRTSNVIKKYQASWQKTKLRSRKGGAIQKSESWGSRKRSYMSFSQKNVPNKYWHLIDRGFTHRSGTVFPGYKFQERVRRSTTRPVLNKFKRVLSTKLKQLL